MATLTMIIMNGAIVEVVSEFGIRLLISRFAVAFLSTLNCFCFLLLLVSQSSGGGLWVEQLELRMLYLAHAYTSLVSGRAEILDAMAVHTHTI